MLGKSEEGHLIQEGMVKEEKSSEPELEVAIGLANIT